MHLTEFRFEGEWTPTVAGSYRVACRVDGCELTHNYLIEVRGSNHIITSTHFDLSYFRYQNGKRTRGDGSIVQRN